MNEICNTVDTLLDEGSPYKLNGYDLVIDTRGIDAYDNLIALYVTSGGKKITSEQYLSLSDEEKKKYKLEITYTPNELILTDEMIGNFEAYLEASSASDDLKKLKEEKGDNEKDYREEVYALYLCTYYKDFVTAAGATVPRLRSYYYLNYISGKKTDRYLFVFDDLLVGGFETDGGLEATFYGLTKDIEDCAVNADNARDFLISVARGATGMIASEYLVTVVRNMPLILIVPAALALLTMLSLKAIGADQKQRKYLSCLRVQGVFLAYAALISGFVNFIFGFFVPVSVLNRLPVLFFFAVMLIRNIAYIIAEKISINKSRPTVEEIIKADENGND